MCPWSVLHIKIYDFLCCTDSCFVLIILYGMFFYFSGLFLFCTACYEASCGNGYSEYSGSCYKYHEYYVTWQDAENQCVSEGGHLVSITSENEMKFINNWISIWYSAYNLGYDGTVWTGLNDLSTEGNFVWSSGEAVTYTNWNDFKLNDFIGEEDCVHLLNYKWNNYPCDQHLTFVCERSKSNGSVKK